MKPAGTGLVVMAMALGLSGCAYNPGEAYARMDESRRKQISMTGYVKAPLLFAGSVDEADGYKDEEISPGIYRIHAYGNQVTSLERVQQIALLRAAMIGRDKAFSRFVILEDKKGQRCHAFKNSPYVAAAQPRVELLVNFRVSAGERGEIYNTEETIARLYSELNEKISTDEEEKKAQMINKILCKIGKPT